MRSQIRRSSTLVRRRIWGVARSGSIHRSWRYVILSAAITIALVAAGGGPAFATPGQHGVYAGQVRDAGLDAAQGRQLQALVDAQLARFGGNQVAANEIQLGPEARLVIPLPGERSARRLAAAREPSGCPYLWFCAYSQPNYQGSVIQASACGNQAWVFMPWAGYGSWRNNQTPGTRPAFWRQSTALYELAPGAYSSRSSYNWSPVWWIQAC